MPTAEKRRLTAAEYLAIESTSEIRHEFLDGEMFAMSGGSLWHNLIKDNFARAVANRLSGGTCRVVTSDQRLKVDATGLDTLQEYLLIAQDRFSVEVFQRQDAGSSSAGSDAWLLSAAAEREAEVRLSSLGITVPLAEIYAGVEFPPEPPAR
jgi:Uma2 family endonuclease